MREIKFRAKRIDDDSEMIFFDLTENSLNIPFIAENYEVMQFTGLLDKAGVEIYEGDIVYIENATKDAKSDIVQASGVITWDYEGADYNICNSKGGFLLAFGLTGSKYEVTGNIYENPSLLTKDNHNTLKEKK